MICVELRQKEVVEDFSLLQIDLCFVVALY